jgi:diaminopimelate decarboxylase
MSSTYNARPLAAEVLVQNDRFDVVRSRQKVEAMFANEHIPDWLGQIARDDETVVRKRA